MTRDPRFVTLRRGGSLTEESHQLLALWSADCAERVLPIFQSARPEDARPAEAIATTRRWAAGEVTMTDARERAFAAHAAAREVTGSATHAARAAGHAVATAHMADHELGGAFYALRAVAAEYPGEAERVEAERQWQLGVLPGGIRDLVVDDMRLRAAKFQHLFG